jgi:hypothetical protein
MRSMGMAAPPTWLVLLAPRRCAEVCGNADHRPHRDPVLERCNYHALNRTTFYPLLAHRSPN